MEESSRKKTLSSGLRGMKFMKVKEEEKLRDQLREEERDKKKQSQWVIDDAEILRQAKSAINYEEALQQEIEWKQRYLTGRRSYKNFNQPLEQYQASIKGEENPKQEADISDEQMAKTLGSNGSGNRYYGTEKKEKKSSKKKNKKSKKKKKSFGKRKVTDITSDHDENDDTSNKDNNSRKMKKPKRMRFN
eukprot:gb/GECH01000417.1/.p1 GENE.gb/GECH01000417.1/~~gb/GECH01000417.1/.p1  ORF type:complete len:190 (+),score=75.49 gb/GECH01000417.1/:1-570(+)